MKLGDLVLVKEADSAVHNGWFHMKTDPRSMDRTVDRRSSDNTRTTVLPRHSPGETRESTVRSSFSHQALSSEASTAASRL